MKRPLKVLLVADSFVTLAFGLLGPIYAIFVQSIGGDILDASSAWAVFLFATGIVTFFVSRWADHLKHKELLIVVSYVILSVGTLGYFFVDNPFQLLLVQVILGVGQAFNNPTYNGLYSKFLDKGKYVSEWGLWDSTSSIVTAVAALGGGAIATLFGFKSLFLVMFAFSVFGLLVSMLLVKK